MSFSRDSRAERKLKKLLRAEMQLKQAWERIDFEEDVVLPTITAMKAGRPIRGLPPEATLSFEVTVDEVPHPSDQPDKK